jgi:hypothetical protein
MAFFSDLYKSLTTPVTGTGVTVNYGKKTAPTPELPSGFFSGLGSSLGFGGSGDSGAPRGSPVTVAKQKTATPKIAPSNPIAQTAMPKATGGASSQLPTQKISDNPNVLTLGGMSASGGQPGYPQVGSTVPGSSSKYLGNQLIDTTNQNSAHYNPSTLSGMQNGQTMADKIASGQPNMQTPATQPPQQTQAPDAVQEAYKKEQASQRGGTQDAYKNDSQYQDYQKQYADYTNKYNAIDEQKKAEIRGIDSDADASPTTNSFYQGGISSTNRHYNEALDSAAQRRDSASTLMNAAASRVRDQYTTGQDAAKTGVEAAKAVREGQKPVFGSFGSQGYTYNSQTGKYEQVGGGGLGQDVQAQLASIPGLSRTDQINAQAYLKNGGTIEDYLATRFENMSKQSTAKSGGAYGQNALGQYVLKGGAASNGSNQPTRADSAVLADQQKSYSKSAVALGTLDSNAATLIRNLDGKINDSNMPLVNLLTNAVKYDFGDADVNLLKEGLASVAQDYATARSVNGRMTDIDKKTSNDIFDGNISMSNLKKVIAQAKQFGAEGVDNRVSEINRIKSGNTYSPTKQENGDPLGIR